MKVYVILYQDLKLNTCKVSQEGYKNISDAVNFCKNRMGVRSWTDLPSVSSANNSEDRWVFGDDVTKQKYTIVEVTI